MIVNPVRWQQKNDASKVWVVAEFSAVQVRLDNPEQDGRHLILAVREDLWANPTAQDRIKTALGKCLSRREDATPEWVEAVKVAVNSDPRIRLQWTDNPVADLDAAGLEPEGSGDE